MDGVVADFIGAALRQLNLVGHFGPNLERWPEGAFLISDAMRGDLSEEEIWYAINQDPGFWLYLDVLPIGHLIVSRVAAAGHEIVFLTSPGNNPRSYSQKVIWARRNFKTSKPKVIPCPITKAALSARGRLLIDDSDKNIDEWRAAGGYGLLVPRVWNSGDESANLLDQLGVMLANMGEHGGRDIG